MKTLYSLLFFAAVITGSISAQCYPDRHNLTLSDGWVSCETTMSPNLARGDSHWIMYDLGAVYELGQSTIWNINNYLRQDDGMSRAILDLSLNGSTWTQVADFDIAKGPVSGTYEGVNGPDLTGNMARFILITGMSNHGGSCVGLSEFRVQATPASTVNITEVDLGAQLTPNPSPFSERTVIDIELSTDGAYSYSLISIDGRIVQQGKVSINAGSAQVVVPGADLRSGMYIFTVTNGQAQSSLQIIKQ